MTPGTDVESGRDKRPRWIFPHVHITGWHTSSSSEPVSAPASPPSLVLASWTLGEPAGREPEPATPDNQYSPLCSEGTPGRVPCSPSVSFPPVSKCALATVGMLLLQSMSSVFRHPVKCVSQSRCGCKCERFEASRQRGVPSTDCDSAQRHGGMYPGVICHLGTSLVNTVLLRWSCQSVLGGEKKGWGRGRIEREREREREREEPRLKRQQDKYSPKSITIHRTAQMMQVLSRGLPGGTG
ncbi:hypothetical protein EYF80_003014 [Liparis tanakae]|uniref:Uncharacterized protein n=1 Tax=Liparis tanakae TaxID=230148 RepID=A0A4Z2JA68_9TELE|nr:hypothetical protein EYF80_003014 [Liparis tanakae]